jgi:chromosome segregation ATPase
MSKEQLKKTLPPSSVEEYLRHGKEASPDDPEERQVGFDENGNRLPPNQLNKAVKKLYQRRLRDYATEFDELGRRRIVMEADIEAVKKDIERLLAAIESAKKLQAFRQDEIRRLNTDLAGITKERRTIERHLAQVEQQLARVRELLDASLKQNSQLAAELAAQQLRSRRSTDGARSPGEPTGPLALGTVN